MGADSDEMIVGLMHVCPMTIGKYSLYKSKRSSELALRILHRMMTDSKYELSSNVQKVV